MVIKVKKYIEIAAIVVGIILLAVGFKWQQNKEEINSDKLSKQAEEYRLAQNKNVEEYKISVDANAAKKQELISAYDVINSGAKGEILINSEKFANEAVCNSVYLKNTAAAATLNKLDLSLNEEDIAILQFRTNLFDNNVNMKVTCAGKSNSIHISSDKQYFYIPITGVTQIDKLTFEITSEFSKLIIDEVYLTNYKNNYDISELATGVFYEDDRNVTNIPEESKLIQTPSSQCLKQGDYLYSISSGRLFAYKQSGDTYEEICSIGGMPNVRDMKFTSDKNAILVAARQSGMFIIDISNPYELKKISHYDSLEAVSGLAVNGNYAFLCSRYFGVEFVDISDLSNPVFINKVSAASSEYQNCFVDGNYLYVAVYGQKRADIYDISNLSEPQLLKQIDLDGACSGLFVRENILYAATGLNSSNEYTNPFCYGKGTGNGMEIYDISDKTNPIHLSTVKAQGRMWIDLNDVWDIQVSGNYAYLTNMFNGLYIYDISDPKHPICKDNYILSIDKTSDKYKYYDETRYLTTWNQENEGRACIYHVALCDGELYMASPNTGIYKINYSESKNVEPVIVGNYTIGNTDTDISTKNYDSKYFNNGYCMWSVDVAGEDIYVAGGESGIIKLDSDLNVQDIYETQHSVMDLKIFDNIMITAESTGGVAIYYIQDEIREIWRYNEFEDSYVISQLEITPDKKYVVLQVSPYAHMLLDFSNPSDAKIITPDTAYQAGAMYYRNICKGVINDKYIIAYGSNNICAYYSDGEKINICEPSKNVFYSEGGGITAAGTNGIAITNGGYSYFDIDNQAVSDLIKVNGISLKGKCSSDGKTLVVSDSVDGNINILDITNIDTPVIKESIKLESNPDIAYVSDEYILIPCRYGGLLKLTSKK